MASAARALGDSGEAAVADWYVNRGFQVVARNWRCREGELDIVAVGGGVAVFCEVKSRSSVAFGAPVEAVGRDKQARIRRLAARFLRERGAAVRCREVRFDVASVLAGDIEVVEGAF
ncbi:MAG TPA: YraN family protein [Acidimicrobiales bacterium]